MRSNIYPGGNPIVLTPTNISKCGESIPDEGSPKVSVKLLLTLKKEIWPSPVTTSGPIPVLLNSVYTSFKRVALREMSSSVSVELTKNSFTVIGWSVRFFPTLGRLTSGGIPIRDRAAESPIPELSRM